MSESSLREAIARALHRQATDDGEVHVLWGGVAEHEEEVAEWLPFADAVLAVLAEHSGQVSDGYHTFDELYEYRMLYNAHAVRAWIAAGWPVVKSWRHSDGEECFGGGWFIVTAELPTGQVSNHYEAQHWGLFHCPEVEVAPAWDGHTPQQAAERLRATLDAAFGGEQA